jgi:hypothetical protein
MKNGGGEGAVMELPNRQRSFFFFLDFAVGYMESQSRTLFPPTMRPLGNQGGGGTVKSEPR